MKKRMVLLQFALLVLVARFPAGSASAALPEIPERGVVLKDPDGNDLVGISGMARFGDFCAVISEWQPEIIYIDEFSPLVGRAMGKLSDEPHTMRAIPVHFTRGLEVPAIGSGRGFEAIEFGRRNGGMEVFLSYEAVNNHFLYIGAVAFEGDSPASVNIGRRISLPENPEGPVHNAGWEAIAYDPENGLLTGVFENRLSFDKMMFQANPDSPAGAVQVNLPPVSMEFRVTDLAYLAPDVFLASIYIWTESYQTGALETVTAGVPQFRIARIAVTKNREGKSKIIPEILHTFSEAEDSHEGDSLNFEGILSVNGGGLPEGILVVNDNDPPYIKILQKGAPPTILRFLGASEYNPDNR